MQIQSQAEGLGVRISASGFGGDTIQTTTIIIIYSFHRPVKRFLKIRKLRPRQANH